MKTTMQDIAAAVKKGKSSLYHYFPSKESVFQAILDKEFRILQNDLAQAIAQEDTPDQKIRAFIITRMNALQKLANFYAAVKDEYLEQYGFIEKLREKYDNEEKNIIKKILEIGIKEDFFAIKDLEMTSFCIFITIKALEPTWILKNSPEQNQKILENIMAIFLDGINKR
jgi:AcrR family transcriptional regulator